MFGARRTGAVALALWLWGTWSGTAWAQLDLSRGVPKGTWELGYSSAFSFSHDFPPGHRTHMKFVWVLPRIGYVLTDPVGPENVRGSLEMLLEPTLGVELRPSEMMAAGAAGVGRWLFVTGTKIVPYIEAGGGILVGDLQVEETGAKVNFILLTGMGFHLFLPDRGPNHKISFDAGYRFQHISNGGLSLKNRGINSSFFGFGLSVFFQ